MTPHPGFGGLTTVLDIVIPLSFIILIYVQRTWLNLKRTPKDDRTELTHANIHAPVVPFMLVSMATLTMVIFSIIFNRIPDNRTKTYLEFKTQWFIQLL
jgi:hypothetical protein